MSLRLDPDAATPHPRRPDSSLANTPKDRNKDISGRAKRSSTSQEGRDDVSTKSERKTGSFREKDEGGLRDSNSGALDVVVVQRKSRSETSLQTQNKPTIALKPTPPFSATPQPSHATPGVSKSDSNLLRSQSLNVPQFYFPHGRPTPGDAP